MKPKDLDELDRENIYHIRVISMERWMDEYCLVFRILDGNLKGLRVRHRGSFDKENRE